MVFLSFKETSHLFSQFLRMSSKNILRISSFENKTSAESKFAVANPYDFYCVKNVHIQKFSGPYFPAFGLNTEGYRVSLRIQSECGKIRSRKTPNTDTFYASVNPNRTTYHPSKQRFNCH